VDMTCFCFCHCYCYCCDMPATALLQVGQGRDRSIDRSIDRQLGSARLYERYAITDGQSNQPSSKQREKGHNGTRYVANDTDGKERGVGHGPRVSRAAVSFLFELVQSLSRVLSSVNATYDTSKSLMDGRRRTHGLPVLGNRFVSKKQHPILISFFFFFFWMECMTFLLERSTGKVLLPLPVVVQ